MEKKIGYKVCVQLLGGEYISLNGYTPHKYVPGEEYTLKNGSAFFLYSSLETAKKTAGEFGPIFKVEYTPSTLPIQLGSSHGVPPHKLEFRLPWDVRWVSGSTYRIYHGSCHVVCHRDTVFASSVKLLERVQ